MMGFGFGEHCGKRERGTEKQNNRATLNWDGVCMIADCHLNSFPHDKILYWSKLKAFADNKIEVFKMKIFVFDRVENIVGKGENAGYQHFLLFPQCFQRDFHPGSFKIGIVW